MSELTPEDLLEAIARCKATFAYGDLASLPAELAHPLELEYLDLSRQELNEVPRELGRLRNLRELSLAVNQIVEVPMEIGDIKRLRQLDLAHNEIEELPDELGNLAGLVAIDVANNALVEFPSQLTRLSGLKSLHLSNNQIVTLPTEVGRLRQLEVLDLAHNDLKTLPTALAALLDNGLELHLDGNPLEPATAEAAANGPISLATYLRSLEEDGRPQYEAKVLLVGEGEVGKTSLVTALRGGEFVAGRPTTHGIEISELELPHPSIEEQITIRIWDFGGQEVYRITHQFFFSPHALFVLVWNPREGQEQNEVEGWLRRIRLRVGSAAAVLIVATHGEERQPELDYPMLKREFGDMLRGHLQVDNKTGKGIAELRQAIARETFTLPHMGQLFSERWGAARDSIIARTVREPQISFEEFERECFTFGVRQVEVKPFAELLHALGQIVYYGDDDGLRDIVVLNPEWLTKAISYVLNDAVTRQAGGVLDHVRLREIWGPYGEGPGYAREFHPYFLRLMEKFEISFRLTHDGQRSLVAQLVPFERPELPWVQNTPLKYGARVLRLICDLNEVAPPGLISWLTVRHHLESTSRHWRGGVFLRHWVDEYDSDALLELRSNRKLALEVRAPSPDFYFNVLRDSIDYLFKHRWPGLSVTYLVPCLTRSDIGIPCGGRFELDGLIRYREQSGTTVICLKCVRSHDVSQLLTGFDGKQNLDQAPSEHALQMRLLLEAVAFVGCPRLYTLAELRPTFLNRFRLDKRRVRLVLWCERPGSEHPADGIYDFDCSTDLIRQASPYLKKVFGLLKVISPIASAVSGVPVPSVGGLDRDELDRRGAMVSTAQGRFGSGDAPLTSAEVEAVRTLRTILLEQDPGRVFGGLKPVQAPSGEVLWVCPNHRSNYDPGLPSLPA